MNTRIAAILAALAVILPITVIVATSDDGSKKTHTVTIHVDGPDRDAKSDDPVVLTPSAQSVEKTIKANPRDLAGNLRGLDRGPVAKLQPPFASDSVPGCRTRTLRTNWSARPVSQSRVVLFWLHYTGGPDRPGSRADVDGLTAFGNSPSARVSWHFNMDKDGNCDYNVPLRYKAWTEANANPTGISIEVAGTGSGGYLRAGGVHQLRRIILDVHRSYPGIQFRLGGVSGCSPTRGGIVTHWMGGPCSGGHVDIKPLSITNVIAQLAAGAPKPPTAHAKLLCRDYAHYKRMAAADKKDGGHRFSPSKRARSVKVRNALAKARYRCSIRGVVTRR